MRNLRKCNAVTEVVGALLLLSIAVVAFSVIYLQFINDDGPIPETHVNIYGDIIMENITLILLIVRSQYKIQLEGFLMTPLN